jgi:L-ascorbate metabolism protein UlaG (beta-lactamase superfamily)
MRLTKFGHACLLLEKEGKTLVIDPGVFSHDLPIEAYDSIVITHDHPDHCDVELLKQLVAKNENLKIYTIDEVKTKLDTEHINSTAVKPSDVVEAESFNLEFYGGQHGISHELWPKFGNVGVFVDGTMYYPGDSFDVPNKPVAWLAVPVSGPWMKTGEAMDFILQVKPKKCFPTHEGLLSDDGQGFSHGYMKFACEKSGSEYHQLQNSESVTLD